MEQVEVESVEGYDEPQIAFFSTWEEEVDGFGAKCEGQSSTFWMTTLIGAQGDKEKSKLYHQNPTNANMIPKYSIYYENLYKVW